MMESWAGSMRSVSLRRMLRMATSGYSEKPTKHCVLCRSILLSCERQQVKSDVLISL